MTEQEMSSIYTWLEPKLVPVKVTSSPDCVPAQLGEMLVTLGVSAWSYVKVIDAVSPAPSLMEVIMGHAAVPPFPFLMR